jgi:hypothetical protein
MVTVTLKLTAVIGLYVLTRPYKRALLRPSILENSDENKNK